MNRDLGIAVAICFGGALLEGLCAGSGVKKRLSEMRQPSFSPPPWAWYVVGVLYYLVVFVSAFRILQHPATDSFRNASLTLLVVVVALNAVWNLLFFRAKNLRAAFFFSLSYSFIVIACWYSLIQFDSVAAYVFGVYVIYLIYANNWGYRMWRINSGDDQ